MIYDAYAALSAFRPYTNSMRHLNPAVKTLYYLNHRP